MRGWKSGLCWALLLSAGCAGWIAPAPEDRSREATPRASAPAPASASPAPAPQAPAPPPELRPLRSDEAEVDLRARTEAAIREAHEGLESTDEPLDPTVAGLVEDLLGDARLALEAGDLDRAHALAVKAATLAAGR